MSWPVARAKAAWMSGDLEWPTGLPTTAYLSVMSWLASDVSFGAKLIGAGKRPGAGDLDQLEIAADVRREGRERRGELDDAARGVVEQPVARRAVDLHALHAAV